MKSTDITEKFESDFWDNNALITKIGDDICNIMKPELAKLNTAGKTVVITDSYLYDSYGSESYRTAVIDTLKSLQAKLFM